MKKIISLLLALSLVLGLAACTNGGNKPNEPAPGPEPVVTPADPEAIYMDFMNENVNVSPSYDTYGLETGHSYSLRQMVEQVNQGMNDEYGEGFMGDVSYSIIDCGLDGKPELALNIQHYMNRGEYTEEMEAFFIIKDFGDNGLLIVDSDYSYYRVYSQLSESGVIWSGGSSGANYWGYDLRYVNGDGESVFLFGCDEIYALEDSAIPAYLLPSDRDPAPFEYIEEFREDGNQLRVYNFEPYYEWNENTYNDHLKKNMFVLLDFDGNDTELDPEYEAYYKQIGLEFLSDGEMEERLDKHLKSLGVTDAIVDAKPIEWMLWDAEWLPKG